MPIKAGYDFCCTQFVKEATRSYAPFEQHTDGTWNINGCCGGGCYVVIGVRYCPFCGSDLNKPAPIK